MSIKELETLLFQWTTGRDKLKEILLFRLHHAMSECEDISLDTTK